MRQIPSTGGVPKEVRGHIDAIKENIEDIRGTRSRITPLDPATATLADVAKKINEVLVVLQG